MTHTSPATYMVWSILSCTLLGFLLLHLWQFDRFRCLKWGSNNGAFKRIMTYSYLLSVPLITAYSVGFAYIKYTEGYIAFAGKIIPKPWNLWPQEYQNAIFPLYLCFSLAWALEVVSHLEELAFWLFLIHSTDAQQPWFRSPHFVMWGLGSLLALGGLPAVTVYTRADPIKSEAWIFLTGATGSLVLTLLFVPVLIMFPRFLRKVKSEGVEPTVVVRLHKFHSLNITRVFFRFVFVVPLLVLAIDGVKPTDNFINVSAFWTDFLAMLAAVGCVVSSMITLMIFFPRNYEQEAGYRYRQQGDGSSVTDELSVYSGTQKGGAGLHAPPPHSANPFGTDRTGSFYSTTASPAPLSPTGQPYSPYHQNSLNNNNNNNAPSSPPPRLAPLRKGSNDMFKFPPSMNPSNTNVDYHGLPAGSPLPWTEEPGTYHGYSSDDGGQYHHHARLGAAAAPPNSSPRARTGSLSKSAAALAPPTVTVAAPPYTPRSTEREPNVYGGDMGNDTMETIVAPLATVVGGGKAAAAAAEYDGSMRRTERSPAGGRRVRGPRDRVDSQHRSTVGSTAAGGASRKKAGRTVWEMVDVSEYETEEGEGRGADGEIGVALGGDEENGGSGSRRHSSRRARRELRSSRASSLHPMVANFTSPIDLFDGPPHPYATGGGMTMRRRYAGGRI